MQQHSRNYIYEKVLYFIKIKMLVIVQIPIRTEAYLYSNLVHYWLAYANCWSVAFLIQVFSEVFPPPVVLTYQFSLCSLLSQSGIESRFKIDFVFQSSDGDLSTFTGRHISLSYLSICIWPFTLTLNHLWRAYIHQLSQHMHLLPST